jgi:hypothetical protein
MSRKYLIHVLLRLELLCKVEKYKSPGSDQIPAEMSQAGAETL